MTLIYSSLFGFADPDKHEIKKQKLEHTIDHISHVSSDQNRWRGLCVVGTCTNHSTEKWIRTQKWEESCDVTKDGRKQKQLAGGGGVVR